MTTSESKGRFFFTKRIDSNRFAQRIESIRIANWNALVPTQSSIQIVPHLASNLGKYQPNF